MSAEGWKLTLPCTRAEADALSEEIPGVTDLDPAPVLVVSEPDDSLPECWQLDAYFEEEPSQELLRKITGLVLNFGKGEPVAFPLPSEDWVTLSQAGCPPTVAGRFHVRTPDYPERTDLIDFVIPAGLAFGTGQHATTAGCLVALDRIKRRGGVFRNVLDLGTGTGLLAFAAAKLWPAARVAASDIDPISIDVVRENAALNGIHGLHLVVADGLGHRELIGAAPYDLVVANILAQPLIDMASQIAASVAPRGTLVLSGLLDIQAAAVTRAYVRAGMRFETRYPGEWSVLVLRQRR
ncbi:MAG: 50S ribosomal protein L11 methyltransferase [Sphingomonadales bacterium]